LNILLTRPLNQVEPLKALINNSGHQPILFPTLKIEALKGAPLKVHYDAVIFISANAVDYGLEALSSLDHHHDQIFAVGAATAKKLSDHGFKVDAFPQEKSSSESLLAMNEVKKLSNKDILIFRGKGGRETLKEGLGKDNVVEYIEVYERTQCRIDSLHQESLTQFLSNNDGVITITSVENLSTMMAMIEQINIDVVQRIKQYLLVVLSDRIKTYAESIGFNRVKVAPQTSDDGLMQAIRLIE
jgi:uroporphyrinogen-III synthase